MRNDHQGQILASTCSRAHTHTLHVHLYIQAHTKEMGDKKEKRNNGVIPCSQPEV